MTLIDRLSKLEGPNREVDAEIMSLFYVRGKRHIDAYMENDRGIDEPVESDVWIDAKEDRWVSTSAHYFTASVDAAIALAERVLPGHKTGYLPSFFKDRAYAGIVSEKGKAVDLLKSTIEVGPTPAIALCIAILRAKEASEL